MKLGDFIEQTLEDFHTRVFAAIKPLTEQEMSWRPDAESNSISFILWHVTRVEDRWTSTFAKGETEVWVRDRWFDRLGLSEQDVGIAYTAEQLAAFPNPSKERLQAYFESVREETLAFLRSLEEDDYDSVPDRSPFPESPGAVSRFKVFSMARMYRQLIGEEDQHLGQISYVRGLQRGLNG